MKPFGVVIWVALLVAALASGCTALEDQAPQGTASDAETTLTPTRNDETTGAATIETPFTAASEMNGGSQGAADSIQGVRFGEHEGYEQVVIDFGSQGAPVAHVPLWALSSPTGEGYARITFPGVDATAVTDGKLGGSILDNFYVVRAPGGGMFVDIFATGAFQYRMTELSDPGRLVVDYRPANVALSSGRKDRPLSAPAGGSHNQSAKGKRLLSKLRSLEHHHADGFERQRPLPEHRALQRLDRDVGVFRGTVNVSGLPGTGEPASRQ